ncbi:MAG TPA: GSCFA domain-containing protein [Patescibacteria group bacterium]|nr:GSCFA domain-containing protein [Patescibacteria group bacterium]
MPLSDLSAAQAIENRKANKFSVWGNRSQPNRVEPIAKPAFEIPFKIAPGEKIFTVGSCFARNVEAELMRRGFHLPMRELFKRQEFHGLDAGVVNNFGTPSIYNEFAWALGEKEFVADDHIVEIQSGKYVDLHVIPSIRPDRREVVEARRRAITEAYRSALDCQIAIITLGLVEIWYDNRTGYYLNSAPLPRMLKSDPERFRLHVLSYDEAYKYLEDALQLLKRKARTDLKVVLTVSPVPLTATHRPQDVMVANTYSKSVLRVVAETIVSRHDFVTYFPSYESIILSDRKIAWREDFTHVTDEVVAVNVGRMVDACIVTSYSSDNVRSEIDRGGVAVAVEKAHVMRQGSHEAAEAFFNEFSRFSKESIDFALEMAQFFRDQRRYQEAIDCLTGAPEGIENIRVTRVAAECLIKLNRAREAYTLVDAALRNGAKSGALWNYLFTAAGKAGNSDLVLGVLARWTRAAPGHAGRANALTGRWFHERGEFERAIGYFKISVGINSTDALAHIYYVETLMALGRMDEAVRVFRDITPVSQSEAILHGRLAKTLGAASQ